MTARGLAVAVKVDEKTAARWLAGRVPHPRHRWAVAGALGVEEAVLWPDAVRAALRTGPDREVVACYPYRSHVPKSLWRDLITGATRDLTFAGYTSYFLWLDIANLRGTLARKAARGASVRFLLGDPDSPVTRERERVESVPLTITTRINVTLDELGKIRAGAPVEARLTDAHVGMSVFRFDDQALVCTHLADLLGHDSPTVHLRRRQDEGLFDRYAAHVDWLWDRARPVWPPP